MKKRLFQTLLLILSLCLVLTGCSKLEYHRAIKLYNEGYYDAAATLFSELDGYKDSGELQTLSRYWEALTLMEEGAFSQALPRFLKLGNYEDSAARAAECKYQLAIAAFQSNDYQTAKNYFLEQPQYRQTPEYLRRICWQGLLDAVTAAGGSLQKEQDGTVLRVTAQAPDQLIFSISTEKDMDYRFLDDLTLSLTRDSLEAAYIAHSSFTMDYLDQQIGSSQTASGNVNISACSANTQLVVDSFQMTVTDNLGETFTSEDPADCRMADTMTDNLSALLTQIPQLLTESGIDLPLADIGFAPLA